MLHACALVGWYTRLCTNQPPYSNIFIKWADEHHEQHWDKLLGEVEQTLMQLKTGSQTTPVPKHLYDNSSRRFATPSFFSFLIFIQINSKLNKIKIWMKLMEEMNSHMASKGA